MGYRFGIVECGTQPFKRLSISSNKASTTRVDLITTILTGRRLESLCEDLRSFDITCPNLPLPAKGPVNAVNVNQSECVWPIQAKLAVNKDCVQNP